MSSMFQRMTDNSRQDSIDPDIRVAASIAALLKMPIPAYLLEL
jgi:hypothetical protein